MSDAPDSDTDNKKLIAKLSATADEIVRKSKNVEPDKTFAANLTKYHNEILVPLASELKVDSTPVVATSPITIDNVKTLTSGIIAALGSSKKPVIVSGTIDKISEFFDKYNYSLSNGNLAYDPDFFEPQEARKLGCGRHALNNLLGGKYFMASSEGMAYSTPDEIKTATANIHDAATVDSHRFDLSKFCGYLKKHDPIIGNNIEGAPKADTDCPANENYSYAIIVAILPLIGYETDKESLFGRAIIKNDSIKALINKSETLGLIINTGDGEDNGHWWTIRKYNNKFVFKDSLNKKVQPYDAFDACWNAIPNNTRLTLNSVIAVKKRDIYDSYKANTQIKIRSAMEKRKRESYELNGNTNNTTEMWLSALENWFAILEDAAIIKRLYDGEIKQDFDLKSTHIDMEKNNNNGVVDALLTEEINAKRDDAVTGPVPVGNNEPVLPRAIGNEAAAVQVPNESGVRVMVKRNNDTQHDILPYNAFVTLDNPNSDKIHGMSWTSHAENSIYKQFWYSQDKALKDINTAAKIWSYENDQGTISYPLVDYSFVTKQKGGRRRTHKNRRRITKRKNKKGGKTKKR